LKVISLGLGTQSTTVYLLSSVGKIERADHAVFADPGAEHPKTYEMLEWLVAWKFFNKGIPIHVEKKSLYDDLMNRQNSTGQRFASIPAFSDNGGMIRRQCTKEYKIDSVIKKIRELHGLKPRQRMPMTESWIGISTDEASRMKDSILPRIINRYPLVELGWNRSDCRHWLKDNNFPLPVKSSCIFCPYQADSRWKELQKSEVWEKAVGVDRAIRNSSKRGIKEPIYLHRSRMPIENIEFGLQEDMFDDECEGYCGL